MASNFYPILTLMGIDINKINMMEAVDHIFNLFTKNFKSLNIVHTINPEFVLSAQNDSDYKNILNSSNLSVPDGVGIKFISRFTKVKILERVSGCDMCLELFQKMNDSSFSVYFLGSTDSRLEKAIYNLKSKYPKLNIVGFHNGYFSDSEDQDIISDINKSGANLLLVGLGGIKKQEKWVWKYRDKIKCNVSIGVGGSIDVYSGDVKRAPQIWQKLNIEWLYRTLKEPRKRFFRIYRLPLFIIFSLSYLIKKRFSS